jgi:hypothetical protein
LDSKSITHTIEYLLNYEKLSYKKSTGKGYLRFENIQLAEECNIQIINDVLNMEIKIVLPKEIKEMNDILYIYSLNYAHIVHRKEKRNDSLLFHISMAPFRKSVFERMFKRLCNSFQREIFPFLFGIIKGPSEDFFLTQYKTWKSLPTDEQVSLFEHILQMKEKYFRGVRTLKGIINKLNHLKMDFANRYIEEDVLIKKEMANFEEFYFIDFAALFRALELGLIHLSIDKFFEGFSVRREY